MREREREERDVGKEGRGGWHNVHKKRHLGGKIEMRVRIF